MIDIDRLATWMDGMGLPGKGEPIEALDGTDVPHTPALAVCEDKSVLGRTVRTHRAQMHAGGGRSGRNHGLRPVS